MTLYGARYTPEAAARIRKLHPEIKREIQRRYQDTVECSSRRAARYTLNCQDTGLIGSVPMTITARWMWSSSAPGGTSMKN